jgi:hypothetical protein
VVRACEGNVHEVGASSRGQPRRIGHAPDHVERPDVVPDLARIRRHHADHVEPVIGFRSHLPSDPLAKSPDEEHVAHIESATPCSMKRETDGRVGRRERERREEREGRSTERETSPRIE